MKAELTVASTIIALCIAVLIALALMFSSGCEVIDQGFEVDTVGLDIEDSTPRYWMIVESAKLASWKVATDDYLPDPWAAVFRLGDQVGTTVSCDMETYDPVWADHVVVRTSNAFSSDRWSIAVYDWELEPSGNNQLGYCTVDVDPGEVEHELSVHLYDCKGAIESLVIRFERYDPDVEIKNEKNPNC